MVIRKMIYDLRTYQSDCVDAFKLDCSLSDIKENKEAKRLAKHINKQGRVIDKIVRLLEKIGD